MASPAKGSTGPKSRVARSRNISQSNQKMLLLILLYNVLALQILKGQKQPPFSFQEMMPVSVSPECQQIFLNRSYNCGPRCSNGLSNNTRLVASVVGKAGFSSMLITRNDVQKVIVASFRSSDGWDNWIYDFMMWKSKLNFKTRNIKKIPRKARVHYGLLKTYLLMRDQMLNVMSREAEEYPGYKIVFRRNKNQNEWISSQNFTMANIHSIVLAQVHLFWALISRNLGSRDLHYKSY